MNKINILLLFILIITIVDCTANREIEDINSAHAWVYQLQNISLKDISNSGFDISVIDYSKDGTEFGEFTCSDIEILKDKGIIPIAYISIGEAEDYRFYWQDDYYVTPPPYIGKENEEWRGNYAVKYWYKEWKDIIYEYLDRIISEGFCGIYLDKVDEFEYWSDSSNGEDEYLFEEEAAESMINLIVEIYNYCMGKIGDSPFYIIPQNGEKILEYDRDSNLMRIVSGWAVEDIFYNDTLLWDSEEADWIIDNRIFYLDKLLSMGKIILSVDYVDNGMGYSGKNKERIDDYMRKCENKGYMPYVAIYDRALDEINIIKDIQP